MFSIFYKQIYKALVYIKITLFTSIIVVVYNCNYLCCLNPSQNNVTVVNSAHFAKRLQKILEYYSLSATAFSEELSFNRSTISHLLSGRNKPSLEFVMKVLERFPEVELYWLLNGKGTFPTSKNHEENTAKLQDEILHLKKNSPVQVEKIASEKVIRSIENKSLQKNEKQPVSHINISEALQKNDPIERIVIFYTNGTFKEYKSE